MTHVRAHRRAECFGSTLHEITAATAMTMQVDATGHHVHAMGIDGAVSLVNDMAALGHLKDVPIGHDNRPLVYPSFRRKNMSIIDLCQHLFFALKNVPFCYPSQIYGVFLILAAEINEIYELFTNI